ncbi:DUF2793 domain-containing protein [Metapseudomonas resinovorans]|uniref:DUF2793 domain-containing protein n=1 Tax=Metapseudomonas resinovorans TaxID=53412 RepID=UPI00040AEFFE|nr:DUF2793 domain-containing protein [Pseudomonas resinovorans]
MTTEKTKLTETANGQANYLNVNAALAQIDQLLVPVALDKDLSDPPGSPANAALYIVGGSPTGDWSGKTGQLAYWLDGAGVWQFIVPAAGWTVRILDELDANGVPKVYGYTGTAWSLPDSSAGAVASVNGKTGGVTVLAPIIIACSDETTALSSGTSKVTFRMPYAMTLTGVRASLNTAQTSGSILTINIKQNGTTILSTKITIDNAEKTSVTAAIAAVISTANLTDDAEITIDLDQVGDGTAKGLKVTLIGYQP